MHNPFFPKQLSTKWARRAINNCLNDMNRNALENRGLRASFEGYYTFVEVLDVALREVKEHTYP